MCFDCRAFKYEFTRNLIGRVRENVITVTKYITWRDGRDTLTSLELLLRLKYNNVACVKLGPCGSYCRQV